MSPLTVPKIDKEEDVLQLYGTKPLLCQRLARDRSADSLSKWPTTMSKITSKLAWEYFLHYLYIDNDGDIAFPAVAIKKAATEAGRAYPGRNMTQIRGLFYVNGTPPDGYVKIRRPDGEPIGPPPDYKPDGGTLDWRDVKTDQQTHPMFSIIHSENGHGDEVPLWNHPRVDLIHKDKGGALPVCYAVVELPWMLRFKVEWSPQLTNLQEIVDILEYAGYFVGIGPRRPVRSGEPDYGRFTLVTPS